VYYVLFLERRGVAPARQRLRAVAWCTPVMGVNLWGASPLY
jgi:hypothetical protein